MGQPPIWRLMGWKNYINRLNHHKIGESRKISISGNLFEIFIWRVSLTNIRMGDTISGGRLLRSKSVDSF